MPRSLAAFLPACPGGLELVITCYNWLQLLTGFHVKFSRLIWIIMEMIMSLEFAESVDLG